MYLPSNFNAQAAKVLPFIRLRALLQDLSWAFRCHFTQILTYAIFSHSHKIWFPPFGCIFSSKNNNNTATSPMPWKFVCTCENKSKLFLHDWFIIIIIACVSSREERISEFKFRFIITHLLSLMWQQTAQGWWCNDWCIQQQQVSWMGGASPKPMLRLWIV